MFFDPFDRNSVKKAMNIFIAQLEKKVKDLDEGELEFCTAYIQSLKGLYDALESAPDGIVPIYMRPAMLELIKSQGFDLDLLTKNPLE